MKASRPRGSSELCEEVSMVQATVDANWSSMDSNTGHLKHIIFGHL